MNILLLYIVCSVHCTHYNICCLLFVNANHFIEEEEEEEISSVFIFVLALAFTLLLISPTLLLLFICVPFVLIALVSVILHSVCTREFLIWHTVQYAANTSKKKNQQLYRTHSTPIMCIRKKINSQQYALICKSVDSLKLHRPIFYCSQAQISIASSVQIYKHTHAHTHTRLGQNRETDRASERKYNTNRL